MFSPNGTIGSEFFPNGDGAGFRFKQILEPLEPIRGELLIYKGIRNGPEGPGDNHQRGMGGIWTAAKLRRDEGWATDISVDQYIANRVGDQTRFKSLEYAIQAGRHDNWGRMCYRGSEQPITPEENPYTAFDRLFSSFDPAVVGSGNARRLYTVRKSVLDNVLEDFNRARSFLSSTDRNTLEQHSDSVRRIEMSLEEPSSGMGGGLSCNVPDRGMPGLRGNSDRDLPAIGKIMMDLMVAAFACDQTSVASMQWNRSFGAAEFPHLGITDGHHGMSHRPDSDRATKEKLIKVNRFYAEQFLYLVQQLKNTPDPSGDGSLMDNTLLAWGNELGKGNSHDRDNVPLVTDVSTLFRTPRYTACLSFS